MSDLPGVPDRGIDFIGLIESESSLFRRAAARTDPAARVPACPDWTAADLLWHLGEVQWFWRSIVVTPLVTDEDMDGLVERERPESPEGLMAFFDENSSGLVAGLRAAAPEEARWMWSPYKTAGYIARRQAHEALIHRVDAEQSLGAGLSPIDPTLAADGVDEVLALMYAEPAADLTAAPVVRVRSTDTGHAWLVAVCPDIPRPGAPSEDAPGDAFRVVTEGEATAFVSGTAADLDLWLWGRLPERPASLTMTGDESALTRVLGVLRTGIN